MVTTAPISEMPCRIILDDATQVSSMSRVVCVAHGDLTVTERFLGCELEVYGGLHAADACIVGSKLRICAASVVGKLQTTEEYVSTLHLFAIAGNWYGVRSQAQKVLQAKRKNLEQYKTELDRMSSSMSHKERERLMEIQFEKPELEDEVKGLRMKVDQLEELIE